MDTKQTRVFKTHWTTQWSNLVTIFDSTIHINMEGGDVSEKNSIATIRRGSSIAIHRKKIHKINHFGWQPDVLVAHCPKTATLDLQLTTKMVCLCIFSSWSTSDGCHGQMTWTKSRLDLDHHFSYFIWIHDMIQGSHIAVSVDIRRLPIIGVCGWSELYSYGYSKHVKTSTKNEDLRLHLCHKITPSVKPHTCGWNGGGAKGMRKLKTFRLYPRKTPFQSSIETQPLATHGKKIHTWTILVDIQMFWLPIVQKSQH